MKYMTDYYKSCNYDPQRRQKDSKVPVTSVQNHCNNDPSENRSLYKADCFSNINEWKSLVYITVDDFYPR